MALAAENAHLELTDGDEAIVVAVLEIDELHRGTLLPRLAVLADAGIFQQLVEHMPVVLQQVGAGKIRRELLHHLLHLIVFQPGIDFLQLLTQDRKHHHLGEIAAMRVTRMLLGVQIKDLPLQPRQLRQQRLLDMLPLVEADLGVGVLGAHERLELL